MKIAICILRPASKWPKLAKILNILEIDTQAVLEAAGTKWNFLKFSPGLVGGHCIGPTTWHKKNKKWANIPKSFWQVAASTIVWLGSEVDGKL